MSKFEPRPPSTPRNQRTKIIAGKTISYDHAISNLDQETLATVCNNFRKAVLALMPEEYQRQNFDLHLDTSDPLSSEVIHEIRFYKTDDDVAMRLKYSVPRNLDFYLAAPETPNTLLIHGNYVACETDSITYDSGEHHEEARTTLTTNKIDPNTLAKRDTLRALENLDSFMQDLVNQKLESKFNTSFRNVVGEDLNLSRTENFPSIFSTEENFDEALMQVVSQKEPALPVADADDADDYYEKFEFPTYQDHFQIQEPRTPTPRSFFIDNRKITEQNLTLKDATIVLKNFKTTIETLLPQDAQQNFKLQDVGDYNISFFRDERNSMQVLYKDALLQETILARNSNSDNISCDTLQFDQAQQQARYGVNSYIGTGIDTREGIFNVSQNADLNKFLSLDPTFFEAKYSYESYLDELSDEETKKRVFNTLLNLERFTKELSTHKSDGVIRQAFNRAGVKLLEPAEEIPTLHQNPIFFFVKPAQPSTTEFPQEGDVGEVGEVYDEDVSYSFRPTAIEFPREDENAEIFSYTPPKSPQIAQKYSPAPPQRKTVTQIIGSFTPPSDDESDDSSDDESVGDEQHNLQDAGESNLQTQQPEYEKHTFFDVESIASTSPAASRPATAKQSEGDSEDSEDSEEEEEEEEEQAQAQAQAPAPAPEIAPQSETAVEEPDAESVYGAEVKGENLLPIAPEEEASTIKEAGTAEEEAPTSTEEADFAKEEASVAEAEAPAANEEEAGLTAEDVDSQIKNLEEQYDFDALLSYFAAEIPPTKDDLAEDQPAMPQHLTRPTFKDETEAELYRLKAAQIVQQWTLAGKKERSKKSDQQQEKLQKLPKIKNSTGIDKENLTLENVWNFARFIKDRQSKDKRKSTKDEKGNYFIIINRGTKTAAHQDDIPIVYCLNIKNAKQQMLHFTHTGGGARALRKRQRENNLRSRKFC